MEFTLAHQGLLQVGPVSARSTLALLPPGKNKKQKVVVGEDSGAITCFETKKGTPTVIFKTLPTGSEVSALTLGGEASGVKDKIYAASGHQIRGMTRKGKEFFKLVTNLTEVIQNMAVEDTKLWTTGELIYNLFDNGRDVAFFMSPDVINSFCLRKITRDTEYDVVIGCRDSRVRVLSNSSLAFELAVEAPVTCVTNIGSTPIPSEYAIPSKGFQEIIYTTQRGQMGQLLADASTIRRGWSSTRDSKYREAPVNSIVTADINNDGVDEILFGRDDGVMQAYGFEGGECSSIWSQNVGESVRSVAVGEVSTVGFKELVFVTYSGKVNSFTTERMDARDEEDAFGRSKDVVVRETQITRLRKEVEALKARVEKEREKYAKVSETTELIAVEPPFKVNTSQLLDPEAAAYKLSVEIPLPIDVVMLQSQIPVDLLDVDSNIAIISKTPPDRVSKSLLLATYRCQESVNRLEIAARTVEGQYGDVQVTVIANVTPGKTAQIVKFTIRPLSLHYRVHEELDDRPMNTLRFSGPFTLSQMHEWIVFLLPDVPPRTPDEDVTMAFKNAFVGTQLLVRYKKGEATFLSDSMSTIAIIKEVLTKQATAKKIRVNMTFDTRDETVANVLKLLHPKLEYTIGLARKVELVEALREIKGQTEEVEFLSAEFQDVLENAEKYQKEMKTQPKALEMLFGLVTDLFVDKHKFRGYNVQHMMPQLMQLLQSYDYDSVLAYFMAQPPPA